MKKGFTLVELMGSILILGILTLIGIGVYSKVKENIIEQQYENKISYIETQAALFASDTGYLSTNVNHLVELGYIEPDNENGEVLSPTDQKQLNDFVITISKDGDIYYGHFTDKEESDINKIDMTNANLEIAVEGNKGENDWYTTDVTLNIKLKNNKKTEADIQKVIWYSNVETKEDRTLKIEVSQIINSLYRVEVIFKDGTKYEAKKTIKIDKQKLNIYGEDVRVENADVYTQTNKTTRLIASDQNGSGIAGYFIGTNSSCTSNRFYKNSEESIEENFDNGTYYACVKDNAGNVSETTSFIIENVDKILPTCEIVVTGTKGENDWYTSDVEFSVSGIDNESGIKNTDISSQKLSSDNKSYTVTGIVRDNAGNTKECSVTVKRDVTKPSCNWNDASYKDNWTKNNRTVTVTCNDTTSNCSSSASTNSWAYTSGTHKTESLSYTIKDNAGNTKTCSKDANIYVDKNAPTKPTSGAIGSVSGSNTTGSIKTEASGSIDSGSGVKEYRYLVTNNSTTPTDKSKFTTSKNFTRSCGTSYYAWAIAVDNVGNISDVASLGNTSDGANSYSAWGTCSKKCGGGTQTRTNTCALKTDLSRNCNTQGCCSDVYYEDGTTCTKSCDGGTYNRLAYSSYDDSRCPASDKDSGGSDCNTQACYVTMYTCRYQQGDCVEPKNGFTIGMTNYHSGSPISSSNVSGTVNTGTAFTVTDGPNNTWVTADGKYFKKGCLTTTQWACCTSATCPN